MCERKKSNSPNIFSSHFLERLSKVQREGSLIAFEAWWRRCFRAWADE